MMDNKMEVKEKLTKEDIDVLKRNLKVCFDVIVKNIEKKEFDVKEFDVKNKEDFLKAFHPWQKVEGKNLIQEFIDNVDVPNSTADFSWLDILDSDERWKKFKNNKLKKEIKENKESKQKYTNMRYQIPEHYHGDIDNAIIFHCLENPRGYLGDWKDIEIDKEFNGASLERFYKESASKLEETGETLVEIIKNRYKLKKTDSIADIVYSEESNLSLELNRIFASEEFTDKKYKNNELKEKGYYYIPEYYSQLIKKNKKLDFSESMKSELKDIAKNICNLEIYPFSCAQPALGRNGIGEKILLNSDLSRFGTYIVLRRIYRYLANGERQKPIFIFRKYDSAWKKLFTTLFKEVEETENTFVADKFLKDLENYFFYCQLRPQGGGITAGNVMAVPDYKEMVKNYKKKKQKAFKEIKKSIDVSVDTSNVELVDNQK